MPLENKHSSLGNCISGRVDYSPAALDGPAMAVVYKSLLKNYSCKK
jgi:hypothetical protein